MPSAHWRSPRPAATACSGFVGLLVDSDLPCANDGVNFYVYAESSSADRIIVLCGASESLSQKPVRSPLDLRSIQIRGGLDRSSFSIDGWRIRIASSTLVGHR